MKDLEIYLKIASLPDDLKKEVGNFIDFLKHKTTSENREFPIRRKAGLAKGLIAMSEDFDEPLDDFMEYMK